MIKVIALLLCLILSVGCVAKITSHPEYNENILTTIENVKKLADLSEFQVSYIKSVLGKDSGKVPYEAIECLNSIVDTVSQAKTNGRELTNEELGMVAGNWDRFAYLVGPGAIGEIIGLISKVF